MKMRCDAERKGMITSKRRGTSIIEQIRNWNMVNRAVAILRVSVRGFHIEVRQDHNI
jgi:hypothetical protein